MTHRNRGFTLIELLVVIAIITLLSSVVMAALNTSRNKGKDAAVKSNLSGIRSEAGLIFTNTNSYSTVCTDSKITTMINAAKTAAGITAATNPTYATPQAVSTATCHTGGSPEGWAVSVPLKTNIATYWCVDDTGKSIFTSTLLGANDVTCN